MRKELKHLCKALVAILLVATFVLAIGCGQKDDPTDTNPVETSPTVTDPGSNTPTGPGTGTDSNPDPSDLGPGGAADAPAIPELAVVIGSDPDTIDPALNSAVDGATLIIHGFEGLCSLDKDGIVIPAQAESIYISDDGLVYTFKLHSGLKWSDGSPLTAHDFVYSWNRVIDPETAADYEYMFDVIAGYDEGKLNVKALDELTLEVNLNTRTAYFLELTSFPTFFPVKEDIIKAHGDAWAIKPDTYIGNGPYKLTEWVPGSHMIYEKNPHYWDIASLGPDKIRFVPMDDHNAMLAGYNSGTLSFIDEVPNDEIPALRGRNDFYIMGQLGTYYISFNVKDPALSNPKLRQALTLAVDREFITSNIGQAGQIPAGAFVALGISDAAPGSSFRAVGGDYYDPSGAGYAANLEKAKELIAEIYPNGNIPTFEYIYNPSTAHQLIAEALQQMWADIGVNITIESQEWAVFLNTRKNGEYQIARNGWLNDYNDPIGMLDLWITTSGNNDAQWSNANYDSLISKAKSTANQAERMSYLHQAEDILFNECVLSPIYYYVDLYMLDPSINGFYASPLGYKYFMYTYR